MKYVLEGISGLGTLLMLALLIRAIATRGKILSTSPYPAYARASLNLSHFVSLCVLIPWALATLNAASFGIWLLCMFAPIPLAGLFALPIASRISKRQPLEATSFYQQGSQQTSLGRFQTKIVDRQASRKREP